MLHACYLLTGAQAEGLREGPRPVWIDAVQLHRRVGVRSPALTLPETGREDGPGVRVPGATGGVERRPAPPVGTTRRAVHGGATGGGDPRVRLTGRGPRAAAVDAVTPPQYARLGAAQRLGRGFPQNPVIPESFARTNGKTPDRTNGKRTYK